MVKIFKIYLSVFILLILCSCFISSNINVFEWETSVRYLVCLLTFTLGSVINLFKYDFTQ